MSIIRMYYRNNNISIPHIKNFTVLTFSKNNIFGHLMQLYNNNSKV